MKQEKERHVLNVVLFYRFLNMIQLCCSDGMVWNVILSDKPAGSSGKLRESTEIGVTFQWLKPTKALNR